jgi:hypothetical protein
LSGLFHCRVSSPKPVDDEAGVQVRSRRAAPVGRGQQPSACQLTVCGPDGDVMVTPVGVGFA